MRYQTAALLSLLPSTLAVVLPARADQPTRTMIPSTVFDSQSNFNTDFDYLYPWGTDHNGAARMDKAHATLSNGVLTLTAQPVSGQPDGTFENKPLKIKYLSGAVHAKEHFTVAATGGFDFSAEVQATTTKGTWPAFWLTAVNGWPPEIDMAEWKGSGKISFNTFNTSSQVSTHDITYPNPNAWHSIQCKLRAMGNGKDVQVKYFMDGTEITTHYGPNYVGAPMWLILNLQMEGSSGSPGPTSNTTYSIRKLEVLSYNP